MLLAGEGEIGHGQALGPEGSDHHFRLIGRNYGIIEPLEKDDGTGEPLGEMDGRALAVEVLTFRVRPDQSIEIAGLELVGIPDQGLAVADAVVACPRPVR